MLSRSLDVFRKYSTKYSDGQQDAYRDASHTLLILYPTRPRTDLLAAHLYFCIMGLVVISPTVLRTVGDMVGPESHDRDEAGKDQSINLGPSPHRLAAQQCPSTSPLICVRLHAVLQILRPVEYKVLLHHLLPHSH